MTSENVYQFRLDQVRSLSFNQDTAETTVEYVDDAGSEVTLVMVLEPEKLDELVRVFNACG